ncbi:MAG: hypothetical protein JWM90_358 [Thermoleophilia bacterium]|nr:hypothetical protein [Thermoleophilia bacterium]
MTEPLVHIDAAHAETASPPLGVQVRTRVVREARRETWFVVNEGAEDLAIIPLELRVDAALRRVDINGEVTEFTAEEDQVLVRLRRPLRPGGGTIVALHFR